MSYQILNDIFQNYKADSSVAEAHGIATAMLCTNNKGESFEWLNTIFDENTQINAEDRGLLVNLFEQTRSLLDPDDSMFEFDLFLPDENDLPSQIDALIMWCQGFLWGMGCAQKQADWQDQTKEILRDMIEFTKLESAVENEDDDAENAFMEIHEYLRSAVLIIRDENNTTA
ncbi:MAG: UPF0149 family protein [Methylococcales bacterium]|nr:UPF0149 family protein [Methylococcales bacterium]